MSAATKSLVLVVCLLAQAVFGAETYESFAKETLKLDLASFPFGEAANGEFGGTDRPLSVPHLPNDTGLSWMTNPVSGKYNRDFSNRLLKYGFRDGKLAVVRVSISAMRAFSDTRGELFSSKLFERYRKELLQIYGRLIDARHAEKAAPFAHSRYNIQYGAMCSPTPESLFLMEMQITPVEKAPWNSEIAPGEKKKAP